MVTTATRPRTPPTKTAKKQLAVNVEYEEKAKFMIRTALREAGQDYDALAARLNAMGVEISARGLENKISRGGFSAAFLLQCTDAIASAQDR
jgi:hypothetical protein